ncbi:MAG TPA: MoaD/ThiS family protein [Chitinophagaceae bacterium]|nr:MoaD/ThiS family protein [Chitinophagaceae bacterium]
MTIEVMFFGQLTDITGSSKVTVEDVTDTETLTQKLFQQYPSLSGAKFRVAVDSKLVNDNTQIGQGSKIAFMPPFSGG